MPDAPSTNAAKLQTIISAWQHLAPNAQFGGMTLQQFKDATKPSFDARDQIRVAEDQLVAFINQRTEADAESMKKSTLVVNGVIGDPNFGPDSPLYEAMGYVRKSARKSGLTRKKSAPAKPT